MPLLQIVKASPDPRVMRYRGPYCKCWATNHSFHGLQSIEWYLTEFFTTYPHALLSSVADQYEQGYWVWRGKPEVEKGFCLVAPDIFIFPGSTWATTRYAKNEYPLVGSIAECPTGDNTNFSEFHKFMETAEYQLAVIFCEWYSLEYRINYATLHSPICTTYPPTVISTEQ